MSLKTLLKRLNRNRIYIKRIDKRGNIDVWIVNGKKIRSKIDPEFTNFGQHFCFKYIPIAEFWIDREATPNELDFFVDHLMTEWKLMKAGKDRLYAVTRAEQVEKRERHKSHEFIKTGDRDYKDQLEKIHKKLLKKTKSGISVWVVDGNLVRSLFYDDFTEGGHGLVYKFVPKDEVWVDDDLNPSEYDFVLLHELYERKMMEKGMEYNKAHKQASHLEWRCRHKPKDYTRIMRRNMLN